jgi:chromatin remodeling complex protein RSC6
MKDYAVWAYLVEEKKYYKAFIEDHTASGILVKWKDENTTTTIPHKKVEQWILKETPEASGDESESEEEDKNESGEEDDAMNNTEEEDVFMNDKADEQNGSITSNKEQEIENKDSDDEDTNMKSSSEEDGESSGEDTKMKSSGEEDGEISGKDDSNKRVLRKYFTRVPAFSNAAFDGEAAYSGESKNIDTGTSVKAYFNGINGLNGDLNESKPKRQYNKKSPSEPKD